MNECLNMYIKLILFGRQVDRIPSGLLGRWRYFWFFFSFICVVLVCFHSVHLYPQTTLNLLFLCRAPLYYKTKLQLPSNVLSLNVVFNFHCFFKTQVLALIFKHFFAIEGRSMSGKKLREIDVTMPLVVRFHKLPDFYLPYFYLFPGIILKK